MCDGAGKGGAEGQGRSGKRKGETIFPSPPASESLSFSSTFFALPTRLPSSHASSLGLQLEYQLPSNTRDVMMTRRPPASVPLGKGAWRLSFFMLRLIDVGRGRRVGSA